MEQVDPKKIRKHKKRLGTHGQQFLTIFLLAVLATILLLSGIRPVLLTLRYVTKPIYNKSYYGTKDYKLGRPLGVALSDDESQYYVTDVNTHQVVVFSAQTGNPIRAFGKKDLKVPVYIALDSQDRAYVTDRVQKAVIVFDSSGKLINKWKPKEVSSPLAITIDDKDQIYISDVGKEHQIAIYDKDGLFKLRFGKREKVSIPKTNPGSFYFPNGIAVDKKGRIYVADSNNFRIQVFDKWGSPLFTIPSGGLPRGIVVSPSTGAIYTADTLGHELTVYDKAGNYIVNVSSQGRGDDQLLYPSGLAIDKEGILYVADRRNSRLQAFKTRLRLSERLSQLLPLAPLISLPWLLLLLAFLIHRKRRYVLSPDFLAKVLEKGKSLELAHKAKHFHISPDYYAKIVTNRKLDQLLREKLVVVKKFDQQFVDDIILDFGLSRDQAEGLAIANSRSLYQSLLLVDDEKLREIAKNLNIHVTRYQELF
ncbi:MAG: hypothetical protein C4562_03630 [Actinobacteria bacterium]|nr:MAG: hypothetical protein C4562_03630 [Actinomycetota bacterium]